MSVSGIGDGVPDQTREMSLRSAAPSSYFHHPAHQRFIEENKGIWDKVFVENAAIDE